MGREEIYSQLEEQIPYLKRHDCTPRVMAVTDTLLDQLVEIQHAEELDSLLSSQA